MLVAIIEGLFDGFAIKIGRPRIPALYSLLFNRWNLEFHNLRNKRVQSTSYCSCGFSQLNLSDWDDQTCQMASLACYRSLFHRDHICCLYVELHYWSTSRKLDQYIYVGHLSTVHLGCNPICDSEKGSTDLII